MKTRQSKASSSHFDTFALPRFHLQFFKKSFHVFNRNFNVKKPVKNPNIFLKMTQTNRPKISGGWSAYLNQANVLGSKCLGEQAPKLSQEKGFFKGPLLF